MRYAPTVALGSALGGLCRYGVDSASVVAGATFFPASTLLANLSGSLFIGWLAGRWARGGALTPHPGKWHFWMTGFCGGYTTFSTFAWEVLSMIRDGSAQVAGLYASGSIGFGILAVALGLSLGLKRKAIGANTE